jgi:hypothetical protein
MTARPRVTDAQRRARLVARHHLGRTADGADGAVRAVTAFHSTDPATPYLGAWARVPGFTTAHLDHALYGARTAWRLHAMRRTLFVVPTDDWPMFDAAAARDIAAKERRRVEQWLAAEMPAGRVGDWMAELESQVLDLLADGDARRTQDLTEAIPQLSTQVTLGSGRWAQRAPVSSRLLYVMAMDGRIVRARPVGSWRSSQYHWASAAHWFGHIGQRRTPEEGRAALARSYLAAHGPATLTDIRWWTGWTVARTRRALADVDAVAVALDGDAEGFALPDDLPGDTDDRSATPTVALLPALDPTPMGWKERDWHLGPHGARLFDRNGNVGPTIWLDGRVVGGWAQRPDGRVVHHLLEDVGSAAAARIGDEAAALTTWMDGVAVTPRFRTPLEKELSV